MFVVSHLDGKLMIMHSHTSKLEFLLHADKRTLNLANVMKVIECMYLFVVHELTTSEFMDPDKYL